MADNKAPESGLESTEQGAPPAPAVSETSDAAPSAPSGVTEDQLKEFGATLLEQAETAAKRAAQSTKDVRFSKFETKMGELEAVVKASGGDWEKVSGDLADNSLRQQVAANTEALASGPGGGTSWDKEWAETSQQMLESAADKYDVTLTEEEKATFQNMKFGTSVEAFGALNDTILAKARGEEIPTAVVASEGAAPATSVDTDVEELAAKVRKLQDDKAPLSQRREAQKELEQAMGL